MLIIYDLKNHLERSDENRTRGDIPVATVEIKYGSDVRLSRGNTEAANTLNTENNFMIIMENEDYSLSNHFRVCGLDVFLSRYINQF